MSDQLRFDLGGAPDLAEPVIGWRIWYARPSIISPDTGAGRWLLNSPFDLSPWPSRKAMIGRCARRPGFMVVGQGLRGVHSSPRHDCTCGLYALNDLMSTVRLAEEHAVHEGRFMAVVLGEVSLWGRVVVAQRGYRAEFAYPRRLWIVPDFKRVRQDDDGVANGLNHYGIDFPGRETTPHPISSLLWRLSNQRNGFDFNRVGAENTIAGDRQGKRDLP